MLSREYLKPRHPRRRGVGANGGEADAWWYGEENYLSVYIDAGRGCHWVRIPRKDIARWLRITADDSSDGDKASER